MARKRAPRSVDGCQTPSRLGSDEGITGGGGEWAGRWSPTANWRFWRLESSLGYSVCSYWKSLTAIGVWFVDDGQLS